MASIWATFGYILLLNLVTPAVSHGKKALQYWSQVRRPVRQVGQVVLLREARQGGVQGDGHVERRR